MAKENKSQNRSILFWAAICLVAGIIFGLLLTSVVTTGQAVKALNEKTVAKSTVDFEEARTNLTLDTLNVNTIKNRNGGELQILGKGDNGGIMVSAGEYLGLESDTASILMSSPRYGSSSMIIGADYINTFAEYFTISDRNSSESIFKVDAENESIQMKTGSANINMVANVPGTYAGGITVNAPWVGITGYHIGIGNSESTAISINYAGDIQLQNLSTGNDTNYNGPESAYACLTADGTLYRSLTPCR